MLVISPKIKLKHYTLLVPLSIFLTLILLFVFFPTFVFADTHVIEDNVTLSMDLKWVNRAVIKVENINFSYKDIDKTISSEVRDSVGPLSLATIVSDIKKVNEGDYKDGDLLDNDHDGPPIGLYGKDKCGQNKETVVVPGLHFNTGNNQARIRTNEIVFTKASGCDQILDRSQDGFNFTVNIQDERNRDIWFKFNSDQEIERVDNGEKFTRQNPENPNIYIGPKNANKFMEVRVHEDSRKSDDDLVLADFETQDVDRGAFSVRIKRDSIETGKSDDVSPDNTTGGNQPELDCETRFFNPLTWFMCPLIEGANLAVQNLDSAITSQLTFDTQGQDSLLNEQSTSGKALFNTWASFRYISLGILVIVGLVMIISQALSFGVFDAYTIKKVLPKLLIGVIGISVSWYLCKFAIEVFNDLGIGVRSLLYGPFKNLGGVRVDQRIVSMLGVAAGPAFIGLGVVGVLSFVVTALMAVIIAFAILVFRRILIILLVVTAPIAIACWILPNTEKVWKVWWDFFSRALVVFPIIALFIAGGRVIAQVATTVPAGQSPGLLESTIAFIAYFGPYFALPAAFKLAGGAIATIGGMANDRSRGVFDRLKKGRQERMSDRFSRAQNEKLYNPNNVIAKKLKANKAATWLAAPHKNLQYAAKDWKVPGTSAGIPGLSAAGRRLESGIHGSVMEQSEKWLQHVNKHGANDKFYRAVGGMYGSFNDETKKALVTEGFAEWKRDANGQEVLDANGKKQIVASKSLSSEKDFHDMAHILAGSSSDSERKAAEALHANAAYTAGLYAQEDMNYASTAVGGAMGLAAHGFFNPDDAADAGNLITKESGGSTDFAHAAVVAAESIGASKNPDVKPGYGHVIEEYTDSDGKKQKRFVSGSADADRSWGALETFAQGDFAQAKSSFYNKGRTGGKIEELMIAGGDDKVAAHLMQQKWRRELNKMPGMTTQKREDAIKKRLSQRDAVISELKQVADPHYSQAPVDSRAKATEMLTRHGMSADRTVADVDPSVVSGAGGAGGGGNNPLGGGPDLGGPNVGGGPKL